MANQGNQAPPAALDLDDEVTWLVMPWNCVMRYNFFPTPVIQIPLRQALDARDRPINEQYALTATVFITRWQRLDEYGNHVWQQVTNASQPVRAKVRNGTRVPGHTGRRDYLYFIFDNLRVNQPGFYQLEVFLSYQGYGNSAWAPFNGFNKRFAENEWIVVHPDEWKWTPRYDPEFEAWVNQSSEFTYLEEADISAEKIGDVNMDDRRLGRSPTASPPPPPRGGVTHHRNQSARMSSTALSGPSSFNTLGTGIRGASRSPLSSSTSLSLAAMPAVAKRPARSIRHKTSNYDDGQRAPVNNSLATAKFGASSMMLSRVPSLEGLGISDKLGGRVKLGKKGSADTLRSKHSTSSKGKYKLSASAVQLDPGSKTRKGNK
ncbi:hypothetical protein OQA88_4605 [Cercophora sp. LCS_1]